MSLTMRDGGNKREQTQETCRQWRYGGDNSIRLDQFLSQLPEEFSRSQVQKWIHEGRVQVNGQVILKPSYKLKRGDHIQVLIPDSATLPVPQYAPSFGPVKIIYEDDHVLVVDKPAGLVVHPAPGHREDSLVQRLWGAAISLSPNSEEPWRAGVVHRLDKETSGLLVFAKTLKAHTRLAEQFRHKTARRIYQAIVAGPRPLLPSSGTIQSFLRRHPVYRQLRQSMRDEKGRIIRTPNYTVDGGKWAVTHYQVVAQRLEHGLQWVLLRLETGRTHQIRVHLSELGFPVLNDRMYGYRNTLAASFIAESVTPLSEAIFLHAWRLSFQHPETEQWVQFQVPWPEPLKALIEQWFGTSCPLDWPSLPFWLKQD